MKVKVTWHTPTEAAAEQLQGLLVEHSWQDGEPVPGITVSLRSDIVPEGVQGAMVFYRHVTARKGGWAEAEKLAHEIGSRLPPRPPKKSTGKPAPSVYMARPVDWRTDAHKLLMHNRSASVVVQVPPEAATACVRGVYDALVFVYPELHPAAVVEPEPSEEGESEPAAEKKHKKRRRRS